MNEYIATHILNRAPIGIMVMDVATVIVFANEYITETLGYTRKRIVGTSVEKVVASGDEELSWKQLCRSAVAGVSSETRIRLLCRNGVDIPCKLIFSFLPDPDGDTAKDAFILVLRDMAADLDILKQIEQSNRDIATMNAELIRSNEELKRVSQLKSNFLSIASHELKTPLTSIKGYSEIIIDHMKEKVDAATYRMLESINRAADRLHNVLNNMLDVTRIEQKRLKLNPEYMDLVAVATDAAEDLVQFSSDRHIDFVFQCVPDLPPFYGDKVRMQQVFSNLLSNALKYSHDNSVIEIQIGIEDPRNFHIVIQDYGIGINKEEQEKIFDPFYEIGNMVKHHSSRSKFMGGGIGLGLSIVKGIIERHGGAIWVESEGVSEMQCTGSAFHIQVPVESQIRWDDNETKALYIAHEEEYKTEAVSTPTPDEEKPIVLIIDGSKEALDIARIVLESSFDIMVADTGEVGLRMAIETPPSIILLDSYLPGLNGFRICRILRTQEETRTIPIAFFSAGTQNDEIENCFSSGADDVIFKPFNGRELVDKVWRLLMKKKEMRAFT